MKILLTLDLDQPASPERNGSEELLRFIWDQLQVIGIPTLDVLLKPTREMSTSEWAAIIALNKHIEQYRALAPAPLESYDLVIGCNLRPETEKFFSSLGVRCLTVRTVPCQGFKRFLLAHANFKISEEYCTQLPSLNNLFHQDIPFVDIPFEERNWWLANRFLINQENKYPTTLFVGTTIFQSERILDNKVLNLVTYAKEINEILTTSPSPYYATLQPMDHEEIRFIKTLGIGCPSLPLPTLLSRKEFHLLVSMDSGLAPVAAAFNKPLQILGQQRSWSVLQLRQFRNSDFLSQLLSSKAPQA